MKKLLTIFCNIVLINGIACNLPSSHKNASINGALCALCSINDATNSYDGDFNTFTNVNLTAGLLTYAEIEYEYGTSLVPNNVLSITVGFPDEVSDFLGGLVETSFFEYVEIDLVNSVGGTVYSYNSSNRSTVEVMDATNNIYKVKVINIYNDINTVRLRVGGIVSTLLGDVNVYEVCYDSEDFVFAERNIGSGWFDGTSIVSVNINHNVVSPDKACFDGTNYDVNSDFTSFEYLLSANLGNEYLYADYDWSGTLYSGLQKDLVLFFEDANLVSVSDIKLLFDSDLIEIEVNYSDLTKETFGLGNTFIEAEALFLGSGKFYVKIDLNDSKLIESVRVKFQPFVAAASQLRLYNLYLTDASSVQPLPVELVYFEVKRQDEKVSLDWATASEINVSHFLLRLIDSQSNVLEETKVNSNGNSSIMKYYNLEWSTLKKETLYAELIEVDNNGERSSLSTRPIYFESDDFFEYSNIISKNETLIIKSNTNNALCQLVDLGTGKIQQSVELSESTFIDMGNLNGMYLMVITSNGIHKHTGKLFVY